MADMTQPTDPVFEAQEAILADVTDRRGWGQEWDQFDAAVKREVKKAWRRLLVPIFERVRRDARNAALEDVAKRADSRTCGDQDMHEDCADPGACEALHEFAADIRAMKVEVPRE